MDKSQDSRESIQEMNEQIANREQDLEIYIDQILGAVYEPTVSDEELDQNFDVLDKSTLQLDPDRMKQAEAVWRRVKIERNACAAIFASEIWQSSTDLRREFSPKISPEEPNSPKTYYKLDEATRDVLNQASARWQVAREDRFKKPEAEWTNKDKAYGRYRKIMDFGRRNYLSGNGADFIDVGIATASTAMWGLVRMIDYLSQKQNVVLTPTEAEEVFKKAYPQVIIPFSSMNSEVGIPFLIKIGIMSDFNQPMKPESAEYFSLQKDKNGKNYLTMDHQAVFQLKDDATGELLIKKHPDTETTWCPARYLVGTKPKVMNEYFNWIMELAQTYVFPNMGQS